MQLTLNTLIKIIIGILVFVAVIMGLYLFFSDYVIDFFKNLPSGNLTGSFLCLLK